MAAVRHLGIFDVSAGTTHEGHLVVYIHCAKCGWNRRCTGTFDNMHVFDFASLA